MALYAFDGVDFDRDASDIESAVTQDSNVWRMFGAYNAHTYQQGARNVFVPGVGTRLGPQGPIIGGAFGVGWLSRVQENYAVLCANYMAGDTAIDVIGFGRGAAIALDFVNKVYRDGIQDGTRVVASMPAIRFVGLFDVVAAFGVSNLGFLFSSFSSARDIMLPAGVQHCFHAMALDERRPSSVNQRIEGAYEVWFRGTHADVGGGNQNSGLNNVSLRWMYSKAMASGLPITPDNIADAVVHPEAPVQQSAFSSSSPAWRLVRPTDLIHYSVAQHPVLLGEALNPIPPMCPIETVADEQTRVAPLLLK